DRVLCYICNKNAVKQRQFCLKCGACAHTSCAYNSKKKCCDIVPSAVISPGALDGNMDSLPGKGNSATLSQKRREIDGEYSDSDNESTASIIEKSVSFQNSILKELNRELRQQIKH
ncbi:hypothetical protein, partial [Enterobacter cloacae complex sp. 2DZ2F20B]|uniref:hypothetical protein n=1 Tax=Enterobacter cloacae complex sp. 2DZ2F20B TaxID=2511993 RepID=UPI001CA53A46